MKGNKRICRYCRNADSNRRAQIKRREEDKLSPERQAALRLRRRKCQLKKIGWTLELYKSVLEEQEYRCAICKRELELVVIRLGATIAASADHEHTTPPKPRGILCGNCNLGIGNLQENIDIMKAAIAYMIKYKKEG
jgi:DNA-directed RNA polymerase subunit RPC12/RpoP